MKKFGLQLTGCSKHYVLIFAFFIFPNFKRLTNLIEKSFFFIMDFESFYEVLLRQKCF